ncbi:MAG: helix-turn-helix domain-containing protein, partial [Clostridia bacterium]|nr:helix-turn-helix domain-containing protein [Clostridia bacterium]
KIGEDLIKSMNQALEYEQTGKGARRRVIRVKEVPVYTAANIKNIRIGLKLSQATFAHVLGVNVKTVEAWEAGTNPPRGTARRLLEIIEKNPAIIKHYVHQ